MNRLGKILEREMIHLYQYFACGWERVMRSSGGGMNYYVKVEMGKKKKLTIYLLRDISLLIFKREQGKMERRRWRGEIGREVG